MSAENSHFSTGDRWAVYNNPLRWGDAGIWNPPAFNVRKFQKRIDRILGTADGKPIVRVVWAWQVRRWEAGEMRQAYRFYTARLPNGDTCDLSPPRWILEERFEPGQYMASWIANRYVRRQTGVREIGTQLRTTDEFGRPIEKPVEEPVFEPVYEVVDSLGDPPLEGFYGYLLTVADHDPDYGCCRRAWKAWKEGKRGILRCWGYYRPPGDRELQILQQAKAARDANPYKQSPHEPLTTSTLREIAGIERSWNEREAMRRRQEADDLWRDNLNIWGHRLFTDDPGVLANGKYHFLTGAPFTETESGLMVPEE